MTVRALFVALTLVTFPSVFPESAGPGTRNIGSLTVGIGVIPLGGLDQTGPPFSPACDCNQLQISVASADPQTLAFVASANYRANGQLVWKSSPIQPVGVRGDGLFTNLISILIPRSAELVTVNVEELKSAGATPVFP